MLCIVLCDFEEIIRHYENRGQKLLTDVEEIG